jgi:hypothetical protein
MDRMAGANDPVHIVAESAGGQTAALKRQDAQSIALEAFAGKRSAGWRLARSAFRPIDLERRARLSRVSS